MTLPQNITLSDLQNAINMAGEELRKQGTAPCYFILSASAVGKIVPALRSHPEVGQYLRTDQTLPFGYSIECSGSLIPIYRSRGKEDVFKVCGYYRGETYKVIRVSIRKYLGKKCKTRSIPSPEITFE